MTREQAESRASAHFDRSLFPHTWEALVELLESGAFESEDVR